MAGAERLMLPVRRVELVTDDLAMSATIGQLYAQHRPKVREQVAVARGGTVLFLLGAQFTMVGRRPSRTPP